MSTTRARRLGLLAGLTATLAVCACTGADKLYLGGTPPAGGDSFLYLSPTGNDQNAGTIDSPWKTFKRALPTLVPGSRLVLLDGTYEAATTGTLNVRCPDAGPGGTVPEAVGAQSGTSALAITVGANHEHMAFVRGDGRVPPISIDGCQNWVISGIHAESQDLDDATTGSDTGSVVVLDGANDHVMISGLLALHPNHYKHAQVIRIGDGASNITVASCELYDFHENGIEARRSQFLSLERNYINSRETADFELRDKVRPPGAPAGSYGVRLEETGNVYVLNNVVEGTGVGFGVFGRNGDVSAGVAPTPIDHNSLRGNIVFQPATIGFRIDSQCQRASPCDGPHRVLNTEIINSVVYRGGLGVSDAGSVATRLDQLSVIQAARGIAVPREPQNAAIPADTATTNTLVAAFQSVGFDAELDTAPWTFSHCDADGGYPPSASYRPDDATRVKDRVTTPADLGACIAYLPAGSALIASGVGASVIYQYDDAGQPTVAPLWSPVFVGCGATPVAGVNDDATALPSATQGCLTVHQRLHVGAAAGCALP